MIQKMLGLPIDVSAHGWGVDRLMLWVHVLMLVLFVGWLALFLYMIVRYRKGKHPTASYGGVTSHGSSYVEGTVAVLELVLLFGFSVPFWAEKVKASAGEPDALKVRVIAQQFVWNIHYPGPDRKFGRTDVSLVNEQSNPIGLDRKGDPNGKDDVVTINQLHVPVDKPVIVSLTTKDVIHSLALPLLRVKQDAIPGMEIPLHFTATMTTEQIREKLARTVTLPPEKPLAGYVAVKEYGKDKDGKVILKKGRSVSDDTVKKLVESGVTEISVGPSTPTEIACAQLCGLGHYRMRGFMTIHTQEGFDKWMAEEVEALQE